MNDKIKFYTISELPSTSFDGTKIFECVGKQNFMLIYDFEKSVSLIGTWDSDIKLKIAKEIPGMSLSFTDYKAFDGEEDCIAFSVYRKVEEFDNKFFYDAFDTLPKSGFIGILFMNTQMTEINSVKSHLENLLSSKKIRETESVLKGFANSRTNSTEHRDIFYESEEKLMLNCVIESLNKAILRNGLAYKIFLVSNDTASIHNYIHTHFLVMMEYKFHKNNINSIVDHLSRKPVLPFGVDYTKEFMNIYGFYNINHTLPTILPSQEEGICIGKFVKDGVLETDLSIQIDPSAINLGFMLTGLPGSGKTREAMSIIDSLLSKNEKKSPVFIITPTKEWKEFALSHKMFFIKLYEDDVPINFFRCPETIEIEKFYGNLSMILSSAANAGPYRNPMEKCMLNAFRKVYSTTKQPDPIKIYDEIEESIIIYHGKRLGNGVKYTKHGENIKSGLENLRGILSKPQYCVKDGIKIEDFLESGAIFDVSGASADTRTQLYALILNQIYALTSNFDTNGDNELRLVVCLEEAQTIFGDEDSPAVQDIKQRIQDFRKQGIGLIMLTHNVSDIDVGIRRLCQLKLYLKQAPDTALIASKDLIFSNVEQDNVILKLKTLSSRIGALSYVSKTEGLKRQQDTIFVKTEPYEFGEIYDNPIDKYIKQLNLETTKSIKCRVILRIGENYEVNFSELNDAYYLRVVFLGEDIYKISLQDAVSTELRLLEGKYYTLYLLNKKGRILKEYELKASEKIYLDMKNDAKV
jgi:hypothetical protein